MIYYVAFYNPIQELGNRVANFAGEDKIDYICEAINNIGESVTILSNTKSIQPRYLKKTVYKQSESKQVIMFASLPRRGKFLHALDVLYGYIQLALYLIRNLKEDDVVLVYHSLGYRDIIRKIRKIKNFKYILEVEELFQFIDKAESSFKEKENKVFDIPDAFIFSNGFLDDKVNTDRKPSVVINGIYKTAPVLVKEKNNEKIKILYAGTLEPQKGVDYVIRSAEFLDEEYEVRIIGFGSEKDKTHVQDLIKEVNAKSICKVYYDGTLKGDEYLRYVQGCDIGTCVQNPDDIFNLYEFPSKIFSYMSNGLAVVANRLKQIENSKISPYLIIADSIKPEDVASAIKMYGKNKLDAANILSKLDEEFKQELRTIIKGE